MKLKSYKQSRKGDIVTIEAQWADRMRRPGSVSITENALTPGSVDVPSVTLTGDAHEVFHTVSGIAQIAWNMGWRPPGLMGGIAQYVQDFKP